MVIGLSAVVVAIQDGEAVVLTVRPEGETGLPFGPFDPQDHRTFELALRAFVTEQTRFELGYVEQLYTFGDKGRDAPLAAGSEHGRVISVGYLALAPAALDAHSADSQWQPWSRFFPYEDWRAGRPSALAAVAAALRRWAGEDAGRLYNVEEFAREVALAAVEPVPAANTRLVGDVEGFGAAEGTD